MTNQSPKQPQLGVSSLHRRTISYLLRHSDVRVRRLDSKIEAVPPRIFRSFIVEFFFWGLLTSASAYVLPITFLGLLSALESESQKNVPILAFGVLILSAGALRAGVGCLMCVARAGCRSEITIKDDGWSPLAVRFSIFGIFHLKAPIHELRFAGRNLKHAEAWPSDVLNLMRIESESTSQIGICMTDEQVVEALS